MDDLGRALIVLGVILSCGIAGGLASYFFSSLDASGSLGKPAIKEAGKEELAQIPAYLTWYASAFVGIVAAFIVPLFLSMSKSTLVFNILNATSTGIFLDNVLVLAGFCLGAAFYSRKFLQSVAGQALNVALATNKELKQTNEERKADVAELQENVIQNAKTPAPVSPDAAFEVQGALPARTVEAKPISPEEADILEPLNHPGFSRRTLEGIMKDLGKLGSKAPSLQKVRGVLEKLEAGSPKLVTHFIGERTEREFYELTPEGRASLEKHGG